MQLASMGWVAFCLLTWVSATTFADAEKPKAAPNPAPAAASEASPPVPANTPVEADSFLEMYYLDRTDHDLFRLSDSTVLQADSKKPALLFKGIVREGYLIQVQKQSASLGEVGTQWTSFDLALPIKFAPQLITFRVLEKATSKEVASLRILLHWKQLPEGAKAEAGTILQAFAEEHPVQAFGAERSASAISLRVLSTVPLSAKEWTVKWAESETSVLFEQKGTGAVPTLVKWPETASSLLTSGTHRYSLIVDGKTVASEELTVTPFPSNIFKLNNFSVGFIGAFQSNGGSSWSGRVGWSPRYILNHRWELHAELGATVLKEESSSSFLSLDTLAGGAYRFAGPWFAEGLIGLQTWFANPSNSGIIVTGGLSYRRSFAAWGATLSRWIPIWDRLELRYAFRPGDFATHQVLLGIGFEL